MDDAGMFMRSGTREPVQRGHNFRRLLGTPQYKPRSNYRIADETGRGTGLKLKGGTGYGPCIGQFWLPATAQR